MEDVRSNDNEEYQEILAAIQDMIGEQDDCTGENVEGDGGEKIMDRFAALVEKNAQLTNAESGQSAFMQQKDLYLLLHHVCSQHRQNKSRLQLRLAQYLIEKFPAALREVDSRGLLPIHVACRNPTVSLDFIQLLVQAWPDSVRQPTTEPIQYQRQYPVHLACENCPRLEVIQFLVEHWPESVGTTVSFECEYPIHIACRTGASQSVIQYLVEQNPIVAQSTTRTGCTPLHLACSHQGPPDTIHFLTQRFPDMVETETLDCHAERLPLHSEITRLNGARLDIVETLVEAWPEALEIPDLFGDLALHQAYINKRTPREVIDYLTLQYPDAVSSRNIDGKTPLDYVRKKHTEATPIQKPDEKSAIQQSSWHQFSALISSIASNVKKTRETKKMDQ